MNTVFWRVPEAPGEAVPSRRSKQAAAGADPWLPVVVAALSVAGLVMVYSASSALGAILYGNSGYFLLRQAMFLILGVVAAVFLRGFDYHRLRQLAVPAAVATAGLLLLVAIPHIGYEVNGARRWFKLGPFLLQPAEVSKLSGIVFLTAWLERRGERIRSGEFGLFPFLAIVLVAAGLLVLEKDLGTTTILVATLATMYLVGGARLLHFLAVIGVGIGGFLAMSLAEPYRLHRLLSFTNPWADPQGSGFQAVQSVLALGSGGLTGVGLGQSVQKYMWLPEAHTDFIFAIIGEEAGLIGTLAVMTLFAVLAWRGYRVASRAPDHFGMLLAAGITSWLALQALINMAAVTDSVPVTGVPLPFVSYGGTSLATCLAGVGILLNISAQGQKVGLKREGFDIGWRNRRAHIPRSRRRSVSGG